MLDKVFGPLAQLVEQLTLNQLVVGSIPTRPTNSIKALRLFYGGVFLYVSTLSSTVTWSLVSSTPDQTLNSFLETSHRDFELTFVLEIIGHIEPQAASID